MKRRCPQEANFLESDGRQRLGHPEGVCGGGGGCGGCAGVGAWGAGALVPASLRGTNPAAFAQLARKRRYPGIWRVVRATSGGGSGRRGGWLGPPWRARKRNRLVPASLRGTNPATFAQLARKRRYPGIWRVVRATSGGCAGRVTVAVRASHRGGSGESPWRGLPFTLHLIPSTDCPSASAHISSQSIMFCRRAGTSPPCSAPR